MFFKVGVILFIGLWLQIQGDDLNHDFNVDIPSYDEYSDWEPLPTFVFENNSTEKRTENLTNTTTVPEEKQEISNENKIENVFHILEQIKERLEIINEPLEVIKEHLNERNEPLTESKELLKVIKEPLEDVVLSEVIKESLEDVVILEVTNEPLEDDGKTILERDCLKDDELEKEVHFAGPVKAKGTVSIGANFGHESPYPITYPYFSPYFYGPFYYPLPYYFPYLPPSDPQDPYLEFYNNYYGIPPKHNPSNCDMETLPDCNPEESKVTSYWPSPGKNELKAGQQFGGFVPASGRISIAAHF